MFCFVCFVICSDKLCSFLPFFFFFLLDEHFLVEKTDGVFALSITLPSLNSMPTDHGHHSVLANPVVSKVLTVTVLFTLFHCLPFHSPFYHCSASLPTSCSLFPYLLQQWCPTAQPKQSHRRVTEPLCAVHAASQMFHQVRTTELNLSGQEQQGWRNAAVGCHWLWWP